MSPKLAVANIVYQTANKSNVTDYCRRGGNELVWLDDQDIPERKKIAHLQPRNWPGDDHIENILNEAHRRDLIFSLFFSEILLNMEYFRIILNSIEA